MRGIMTSKLFKSATFLAIALASIDISYAVERAEEEFHDAALKNEPLFLVVTPPDGLKSGNKSGASETWETSVIEAINESLPKNKSGIERAPLPDRGWDGSLSFEIEPSGRSQVLNSLAVFESSLAQNKSGNTAGSDYYIDGIKYPMQVATSSQWMYEGTSIDIGAANIKGVWNETKGENISSDLISQDNETGRDADPTDEGDFITAAESNNRQFIASSWHGAHVQGTVGAAFNSQNGYTGVAPMVNIVPIRVLGKGGGRDLDIQDAVAWAAGADVPGIPKNPNPAHVINLSLGTKSPSPCTDRYQKVFDLAESLGSVVVVAAGNESAPSTDYAPGNCNNIITVASNSREGRRAYYSNYGPNISISAPGGEAYKRFRDPKDGKYYLRETKGNAVLSTVRPLTVSEVKDILTKSAASFPEGDDPELRCDTSKCGAGLIDAQAALNLVKAMPGALPIESPKATDDKWAVSQDQKCLSEFEVAKLLYGEPRAEKMFPEKFSYSGGCPVKVGSTETARIIRYTK